jgi:hypothetical protein
LAVPTQLKVLFGNYFFSPFLLDYLGRSRMSRKVNV